MISFVIYLLAAFGLAFVLGYSEVSFPFRSALSKSGALARWFLKLLECPGCVGVHIGWSWVMLGGAPFFGASSRWVEMGLLAFATCASNLLLARLAGLSEP